MPCCGVRVAARWIPQLPPAQPGVSSSTSCSTRSRTFSTSPGGICGARDVERAERARSTPAREASRSRAQRAATVLDVCSPVSSNLHIRQAVRTMWTAFLSSSISSSQVLSQPTPLARTRSRGTSRMTRDGSGPRSERPFARASDSSGHRSGTQSARPSTSNSSPVSGHRPTRSSRPGQSAGNSAVRRVTTKRSTPPAGPRSAARTASSSASVSLGSRARSTTRSRSRSLLPGRKSSMVSDPWRIADTRLVCRISAHESASRFTAATASPSTLLTCASLSFSGAPRNGPSWPMSGPPGRTHSWGPSPVRAKRSRLRYRTGLPSDSA